jgi:hypothetical protein
VILPAERFELPTNGLQNRCSTTELSRHINNLYADLIFCVSAQVSTISKVAHHQIAYPSFYVHSVRSVASTHRHCQAVRDWNSEQQDQQGVLSGERLAEQASLEVFQAASQRTCRGLALPLPLRTTSRGDSQ